MVETTVPVCGICSENDSKYNCPHCDIRYCSVKCFKSHINTHDQDQQQSLKSESQQTINTSETTLHSLTLDSPSPPPDNRPFALIQRDPRFSALFEKYPSLKSDLRHIYHLTKHPSALPEDAQQELEEIKRRNPNTSKRARTEIWTQKKADERALGMMIELQLRDEGVAEFLELSGIVAGGGESNGATMDFDV